MIQDFRRGQVCLGVRMPLLLRSQSRRPPISLSSRTEPASNLHTWTRLWIGHQIPKCCSSSEGGNYMKHIFYNMDSCGVHLQAPKLELKKSSGAGSTNYENTRDLIGAGLYTSLPLHLPLFFPPSEINDLELN